MKLFRAARWKENIAKDRERKRKRARLSRRVARIKYARALIRTGGFSQIAVRCPRYFYTQTITTAGEG